MKAYIVSGVLALSAMSWADTLQGRARRRRDGQYFDDGDQVWVQGGGVAMMHGRPFAAVLDTAERMAPVLHRIRGVTEVSVDRHGIRVDVEPDHDPIPDMVARHPIHVMPTHTGMRVLLGADLAPPQ